MTTSHRRPLGMSRPNLLALVQFACLIVLLDDLWPITEYRILLVFQKLLQCESACAVNVLT
jgi:hypothetical protein